MLIKYKYLKYLILILTIVIVAFLMLHNKIQVTKYADNFLLVLTDNKYEVTYGKYDSSTKKFNKLYKNKKSAYPTGLFLSSDNSLYYTKKDDNGYTQLYKLNLKTMKEKQITNELHNNIVNVDFIDINTKESTIYMRVIQNGHSNMQIATYSIKTNIVRTWNKDENDISVQRFDYSPSSNTLLVALYSLKQEFQNMKKTNETQNFIKYTTAYNLVQLDSKGKKINEIDLINKPVVDIAFSAKYNLELAIISEMVNIKEHKYLTTIRIKDIKKNKFYNISFTDLGYDSVQQGKFSLNDYGFYFIASKTNDGTVLDEQGGVYKPKKLYYYNLKSKEISIIFELKNNTINNFLMINS